MSTKDFTALQDFIENKIPFNHFLGVKVRSLKQGQCTLTIPYRPELLVGKGTLLLYCFNW